MVCFSALEMACWDIVGKEANQPVYKLLGGETKKRIPAYCTGNDIEQHVEYGFTKLKLAIPHGPADGRDGMIAHADQFAAAKIPFVFDPGQALREVRRALRAAVRGQRSEPGDPHRR